MAVLTRDSPGSLRVADGEGAGAARQEAAAGGEAADEVAVAVEMEVVPDGGGAGFLDLHVARRPQHADLAGPRPAVGLRQPERVRLVAGQRRRRQHELDAELTGL